MQKFSVPYPPPPMPVASGSIRGARFSCPCESRSEKCKCVRGAMDSFSLRGLNRSAASQNWWASGTWRGRGLRRKGGLAASGDGQTSVLTVGQRIGPLLRRGQEALDCSNEFKQDFSKDIPSDNTPQSNYYY